MAANGRLSTLPRLQSSKGKVSAHSIDVWADLKSSPNNLSLNCSTLTRWNTVLVLLSMLISWIKRQQCLWRVFQASVIVLVWHFSSRIWFLCLKEWKLAIVPQITFFKITFKNLVLKLKSCCAGPACVGTQAANKCVGTLMSSLLYRRYSISLLATKKKNKGHSANELLKSAKDQFH